MHNSLLARGQQQRPSQLSEQQKRIQKLYSEPMLLEALADRTVAIPANTNVEQLLRDLSQVYLGLSDFRYPMD